jgi:uncharacterized protein with beta-barrel porin domain
LAFGGTWAGDTASVRGKIDASFLIDNRSVILRSRLAWAHNFATDSEITAAFQTLPGSSFTISGARPDRDLLLASTEVDIRLTNRLSIEGRFDSELGQHSRSLAGSGTLRYAW